MSYQSWYFSNHMLCSISKCKKIENFKWPNIRGCFNSVSIVPWPSMTFYAFSFCLQCRHYLQGRTESFATVLRLLVKVQWIELWDTVQCGLTQRLNFCWTLFATSSAWKKVVLLLLSSFNPVFVSFNYTVSSILILFYYLAPLQNDWLVAS